MHALWWKFCARDYGAQCFVLCTLCTQQMWSTLTAFSIFGSIMSSLEGVLACEHQREMNKNCQLPVHTRLKLICWNKHPRSLCADLRFLLPGYSPRPDGVGYIYKVRFGTEPFCWQRFVPVEPSLMSVKCGVGFSWGIPLAALLFCPLKLHICFINTRVALAELCAFVQFICSQGIYFAYPSYILVGCAI